MKNTTLLLSSLTCFLAFSSPCIAQKMSPMDQGQATAEKTPLTFRLSIQEQEQLLATYEQELEGLTTSDRFSDIIALHNGIVKDCPDTDQAAESLWQVVKLKPLLLTAEQNKEERIHLLNRLISDYPDSPRVPQARERLIRLYGESGHWCQAVELMKKKETQEGQENGLTLQYALMVSKCRSDDTTQKILKQSLDKYPAIHTVGTRLAEALLASSPAAPPAALTPPLAKESESQAEPAPVIEEVSPVHVAEQKLPEPKPTTKQILATLHAKKRNMDYVGRNEKLEPNGSKDNRIDLKLAAMGKTITAIKLTSINGQQVTWDTIPGNEAWAIGVCSNLQLINNADGSITYTQRLPLEKLSLWIQDNDVLAGGKTDVHLTVTFADGSSETTLLSSK